MIHRGVQILLFAFAACAANPSAAPAGEKSAGARESGEERFLREAQAKLHARLFGADAKTACEKHLRNARGRDRMRLLVVMSQYYRWMEGDPVAALDVIGETVLTRGQAEEWKRTRAAAEDQALEKWQTESRKARAESAEIPPRPSGLAVPFPAVGQWAVGWSNIECVIEIAHAHMDLKRWREALQMADLLGRNYEGITRVLAGECAADAMMGMSRFGQAVDLYRFALSGFPTLASVDGKIPAEYEPIRVRIEESLNRALRQQEIEAYGLGYVLYRDARRKHHTDKAGLEALLMYEDLARQFDKTVYGEAARAYACQCLLALAEPDTLRNSQESIRKQEEVIRARETKLALMKQARVPKGALNEAEAGIAREKERLKRLQAAPSGKEAATLAGFRGMGFLKENEFGLYRGEVLTDLGTHAFDRQLDSAAAERLFEQAWNWLEKVETVDARLDAYEVPDKARAVSAPPQTEEKLDYFGNVTRVALPPEAIVNRRTCRWYLNDLRERCALALGFLEFAKGRQEEAKEWYAKVVALDSKTGYLQSKGEWNNYKRLKWGADNGYLFAHPEELALFKGRHRFAVLMGDFHYCTERFDQARTVYRRLLAGEFGPLGPGETDYAQYGAAMCAFWLEGKMAAWPEYLKVLSRRSGTLTEDRAAFCAGNMALDLDDARIREQGLFLLKKLANSGRKNSYVYRAMITYGRHRLDAGEEKEGIHYLAGVPKDAASYYDAARYFLEQYRIRQKAGSDRPEGQKVSENGS